MSEVLTWEPPAGTRGPRATDPLDRLLTRLQVHDCWVDPGPVGKRPQIQVQDVGGRSAPPSYRYLYERLVRVLGPDEHLHHWCRNIRCCNPDHLMPMSQADNNRQDTWKVPPNGLVNRGKTHCVNGHEFTQENTGIRANGSRACKACLRERKRNARG